MTVSRPSPKYTEYRHEILVEEAGGRTTATSGVRLISGGSLVTTNGDMHAECLDVLIEMRRAPADDPLW